MRQFVAVFLLIVSLSVSLTIDGQAQSSITLVNRTPNAGAVDVDSNTAITLVFSEPVIPLTSIAAMADLPAPVLFTPTITGTGEWLNTVIWKFTPHEPLPINTSITVRTDKSFVAADGSPLAADEWQFTTGYSRVTSISIGKDPNWTLSSYLLDLDTTILLRFSRAIDLDSAAQLVALHDPSGTALPVTLARRSPTEIIIDPVDPLTIATEYTVVVTDWTSDQRKLLEAPFSERVHTIPLPSIEYGAPAPNGEISIDLFNHASIQFVSAMNLNSFEGRIRVEPETVEWEPITSPGDLNSFYIDFEPVVGQRYTITLLAGAEDIYGNVIETDYTWSFTVVAPPPLALASYLAIRDAVSVTNAYRSPTRVAMVTKGNEDFTSNLTLYHAGDIASAMRAVPPETSGYMAFTTAMFDDSVLIRSWQQTFNGGGSSTASEVLLASDSGQLEPGLYILQADEYRQNAETPIYTRELLLAVSTAILTVRRSPTETLIWVTDMQTSAPLSDVTVTLYKRDGTTVTGITDQNGVIRLPTPAPEGFSCYYYYCRFYDYIIITAEAPGVYGAWYSAEGAGAEKQVGYLYTDRRVYRPGDTVYFRGVLRDKDDMTYTVPLENEVTVTVCANYGGCREGGELQSITVPISYWGTIDGAFDLPASTTPGTYHLETNYGNYVFTEIECYSYDYAEQYCDSTVSNGTQFTVATFDIPEFEMWATPNASEGMQGEPLGVAVQAQLYSGSPLGGARVDWRIQASGGSFHHEDYTFTDARLDYRDTNYYFETSDTDPLLLPLTTGNDGKVIIPTDSIVAKVPLNVNMGINVTEGGESHVAKVSFFLHSTGVYVGLRSTAGVVQQGETITIDAITVSPEHNAVPNQSITYTLEHLHKERRSTEQYGNYYWETVTTPVSSGSATTGADGTTIINFPAEQNGRYRLRATTQDEEGRLHSSIIEVRVGDEPQISFDTPTYEDKTFTITADRGSYQPGETARLQIWTPGSGTLLLTVQRQEVLREFVLNVSSTDPLEFELPLGYEDAPNVFIAGTFVQGMRTPEDSPSYATATAGLMVESVHRDLKVEVSASSTQVTPGSPVTFEVRVTDQLGMPVRAEVGWALVDEAVLSLAPSANQSLMATFYRYQGNRVISGISLRGLVDDLTDSLNPEGLGGGGGGGDVSGIAASLDPRQDYKITPLWLPDVVTDDNGYASVKVVMPDNLTRWRLDVRVVSLSTLVGQAELSLTTSLPFFVRPQTPRFLVAGDMVELAMFAHNETDTAQTVTALIESQGVTLLEDAEQIVTLPAHTQQRIAWRVYVDDVEAVDVTFYAGNDTVQDAARPDLPDNRIPVLSYVSPDTTATAGILDTAESRTEVVHSPENALESELRVSLTSSLVDTVSTALDVYPPDQHETIDRLISRLMMNATLYRAGGHEALVNQIRRDIQRLDELRIASQGGWNWTPNNGWDLYVTGYAMIALHEAADAEFTAAQRLFVSSCGTVNYSYHYTPLGANDTDDSFYRLTFMQYIRSLCGWYDINALTTLFAFRQRLSRAAQGMLLLTLTAAPDDLALQDAANTLTDDLLGSAIITATGVHWEGRESALWDTDTLTTAVILRALTAAVPDHELLPNSVRWLTTARKGDRWSTPLDTAWGVTTLLDYAYIIERSSPTYTVDVQLDDAAVLTQSPSLGLDGHYTMPLNSGEHTLLIDRSDGDGILYYTATLHATLNATSVPAASRGITVVREYLNNEGNPVDSVYIGARVFVRLTVIASQDIYYLVVEDPLPAGLIADDPSLINTATSGMSVTRTLAQDDLRWFYGSGSFSRSVYTDTRVLFYANTLPAGTYVVTYEARAGAAGAFQVIPTYAYAAVTPDIFGRSEGRMFTINALDTAD